MKIASAPHRHTAHILACGLLLFLYFLASCANPEIPASAQAFLQQYFPNSTVVLVEYDADEEGVQYEVWLNDGAKVEFDRQGQWLRVARKQTGVPASLIPDTVMQYVKSHYPHAVVTKFSRKVYGYKMELSDDIDLRFDGNGTFIDEID